MLIGGYYCMLLFALKLPSFELKGWWRLEMWVSILGSWVSLAWIDKLFPYFIECFGLSRMKSQCDSIISFIHIEINYKSSIKF